jgi:peptidyl-prolyl cis-trans isomerase SurA
MAISINGEARRRRALALLIGLVLWATLPASAVEPASAADRLPVDRIAAVVATDIILLSEVLERAAPAMAELEKAASQGGGMLMLEGRAEQVVRDTLQAMIDELLVTQQAREMKIKVTNEEVDLAIANMARENRVDLETFEKALAARGKDMLTYRAEMRADLLKYKVLNLRVRGRVKIADEEARQYYNDQVREVRATGSFTGAHILVRVPAGARAAEVAHLRKRAEELRRRVDNGEDFARIAREESADQATAPHGGSLGERRTGEIPATLDRAFLDLEPGEVAGPIRTTAGFHVIRLVSRQALGVQSFAEVKNRIVGQLMQEEMVRQQKIWLKELRLRTFIDVRI